MAKIADRLRQQTPRRADEVERGRRYVREAVGFEAGSASAVTLVYGTASSCREQRRVGLELAWVGQQEVRTRGRKTEIGRAHV